MKMSDIFQINQKVDVTSEDGYPLVFGLNTNGAKIVIVPRGKDYELSLPLTIEKYKHIEWRTLTNQVIKTYKKEGYKKYTKDIHKKTVYSTKEKIYRYFTFLIYERQVKIIKLPEDIYQSLIDAGVEDDFTYASGETGNEPDNPLTPWNETTIADDTKNIFDNIMNVVYVIMIIAAIVMLMPIIQWSMSFIRKE